jgi:hypothetical protein
MPPQSFLPSSSVFERASTRSNPALINRMTHTSHGILLSTFEGRLTEEAAAAPAPIAHF